MLRFFRGHVFKPDSAADAVGYILNEEALKQVGHKHPIGKSLTMWGRKSTIIGIVKNFHFNSLHDPIKPIVLWLGDPSFNGNMLIKTKAGQTKQTLESLAKLSREMNLSFPFT